MKSYPGQQKAAAHWPIYTIPIAAALVVLARLAFPNVHARFDGTSLTLFGVAGTALLVPYLLREIPRLKRVKYGGAELEFRDLEQQLSPAPAQPPAADARTGETLASPTAETLEAGRTWSEYREAVKERSREVFLAHVLRPSTRKGQKYDLFIFLSRGSNPDLSDVDHAEFFFGRYWQNRVFRAENSGERIGVSTSAYGPFLAVCRITFKDGYQACVERLIDFEMARVFETTEEL